MSSPRLSIPSLLLLLLHVFLSPISTQDSENEIQDEDEELLNTLQTETTGLSIAHAFRCGIFIVNPKDPNDRPVTTLKVFPALFEATDECEAGKPNTKRYNNFCSDIMEKITKKKKISLKMPSTFKESRDKGLAIGDDICGKIKKDVKAPFVGGKRSRKFPQGLQFGLFSNACNESSWHYAGYKHDETICCGRGNMIDCPF